MDYQTYKATRDSLLGRLYNAKRALCPKTAMARARDIARLESAYKGTEYNTALTQIIEHYELEQRQ